MDLSIMAQFSFIFFENIWRCFLRCLHCPQMKRNPLITITPAIKVQILCSLASWKALLIPYHEIPQNSSNLVIAGLQQCPKFGHCWVLGVKPCYNTSQLYTCGNGFRNCVASRKTYLNNVEDCVCLHTWKSDWGKSSFEIGKNLEQIRTWRNLYKGYAWDCIPTIKSNYNSTMAWSAFIGFDKWPLIIMPPKKRKAQHFITIVYKGALNKNYLLHDHSEQL